MAMLAPAIAASTVLLPACSVTGAGGEGRPRFVTDASGIDTAPKDQRQPAGPLKGKTIEGKDFDISSLRGKVVVVNVWGSWCAPCRQEAPIFSAAAKRFKQDGVTFVGIDTRDPQRESSRSFEQDFNITYPSLYDPSGKILAYGFPRGTINSQAIPSTIVLDRQGKIAARALQPLDEKGLRKMINPLIMEK
ncbi:TlpA disulfide reductase family protein [Streptomyces sp. NPDC047869]|uniref:TlpA family protein disulfide reductase n=1 Tax=Streptomyces sp. NPDC047869 TaxID=3154709 RepID=UPI0034520CA1